MLHLIDPGLEAETLLRLRGYQAEVDAAGTYAEQVQAGKDLYDRYSKRVVVRSPRHCKSADGSSTSLRLRVMTLARSVNRSAKSLNGEWGPPEERTRAHVIHLLCMKRVPVPGRCRAHATVDACPAVLRATVFSR